MDTAVVEERRRVMGGETGRERFGKVDSQSMEGVADQDMTDATISARALCNGTAFSVFGSQGVL